MLTISRRSAQRIRAVMRRAFGTRGPGPAVCFTVAAGMLNVRAGTLDIAVEYAEPNAGLAETLWLPASFLDDCSGKQDEHVRVEKTGKRRATAQWRDGSVPQCVQYDSQPPANADKLPSLPETFADNPPDQLKALREAHDTTDPSPTRYAVDCIQLRSNGSIWATDGRHLLVQSGFQFLWQDDLLVPGNKVFASPELATDTAVRIGKAENWVAVQSGPWTIYLAVNTTGRFPDFSRVIPKADDAKAHCLLSAADAEFLAETLSRLPCHDDDARPVTLDLNGQVIVRAKSADSERPTEVVLSGASISGEPIRMNTNRTYLARALRMGLRELSFTDDKSAILGLDARTQYLWMPLDAESAIPPAADAIRIVSPATGTETVPTHSQPQRRVSPVTEPVTTQSANAGTNGNGHAKTNGQARNGAARKTGQDIDALIRQAEILRTAHRESLVKTNDLLKALKRHRRQSRALQTTIASLRQLKTLGV